jgi:hypothetical protein
MVGPQQISFGEVALLFICQEHSVFHSYNFNECSSFSSTTFGFRFRLDLCSDLVISLHQGVFFASGLYWFSPKEVLTKSLNGVGKEKKIYAKKSGTRRSLCRLRPRLLHVVLDVFLIVCLVVLL